MDFLYGELYYLSRLFKNLVINLNHKSKIFLIDRLYIYYIRITLKEFTFSAKASEEKEKLRTDLRTQTESLSVHKLILIRFNKFYLDFTPQKMLYLFQ